MFTPQLLLVLTAFTHGGMARLSLAELLVRLHIEMRYTYRPAKRSFVRAYSTAGYRVIIRNALPVLKSHCHLCTVMLYHYNRMCPR